MKKLAKHERLVLGSAGKLHPNATTLDIDPTHNPDVVHDLHIKPFPFKDNQFKEITCHHVLEHLTDLNVAINELHRISSPDGIIYIESPHHTSWCAHTPEHKLFFNYFAFDGYIQDGKTQWITGNKFKLIRREITFHRLFRTFLLHKIFNHFPFNYERFWKYMFPAEHIKFWLQPIK